MSYENDLLGGFSANDAISEPSKPITGDALRDSLNLDDYEKIDAAQQPSSAFASNDVMEANFDPLAGAKEVSESIVDAGTEIKNNLENKLVDDDILYGPPKDFTQEFVVGIKGTIDDGDVNEVISAPTTTDVLNNSPPKQNFMDDQFTTSSQQQDVQKPDVTSVTKAVQQDFGIGGGLNDSITAAYGQVQDAVAAQTADLLSQPILLPEPKESRTPEPVVEDSFIMEENNVKNFSSGFENAQNFDAREESSLAREDSPELIQPRQRTPSPRRSPSPREPTPPPKEPTPPPREPTPPPREPTPPPREPTPPPREPTPPPREPTPPPREPTPPPREPTPPPREPTPPPREPTPPPRQPTPPPREPTPPLKSFPEPVVSKVSSQPKSANTSYPPMDEDFRRKLAVFRPRAWFHPEQLDPRVAELIYWRDVKKSAVALTATLSVLLALTFCSLISVLAYSCLLVLVAAMAFRIYKNVYQAVKKTQDGHPFKDYLSMDMTLPSNNVHSGVDVVLGQLNSTISYLQRVFLVEDFIDSCKFACYLWVLTYIGAWLNGLTIIILVVIALFSLPKAYEQNKAQVDEYLALASNQISQVVQKVKAVIPMGGGGGAAPAVEKKEQ